MKTIHLDNMIIEVETYERFTNIVRAYQIDGAGDIVAFLGKYIIGSRAIDLDDAIARFKHGIH